MKKYILYCCVALMAHFSTIAQINVNINIGSQPVWGPVGYDYARYYYMPDIDAYYSIPNRQFIYLDGGRWVFAASLPARFNYDPYRGYKVVINDSRPYLHPDVYRQKYGRYKGWYGKQPIIRDSRDERYYVIKEHPMHGKGNQRKYENGDYPQNNGNGRGNGNGHGNGHGNGNGKDKDHGNGHGNGHGHDHDD